MIYKIAYTKTFMKAYASLPENIKQTTKKQIERLRNGEFKHPSLRLKKMMGKKGEIWEASITMNYRMTFQIDEDIITFRVVGIHDILK